MASVDRLKSKAKQAEAKQNWKAAIGIWNEVIELQRSGKAPNALDLAQYNRIGDLHLKVGEPAKASDFFESAADRYIESGFQNNAIALCNKVLRYAPSRIHIYLKLAKLLTQKGFVSEGKGHFLTYAERMQKAGREAEAVAALRELSQLAPNSAELQGLLDQYGVGDSAASAVEVDPEYQVDEAEGGKRDSKGRRTKSLVFLSVDEGLSGPVARPTSADSRLPSDLPLLDPEAIEAEAEERERKVRESRAAEAAVTDDAEATAEAEIDAGPLEVTPTVMDGATVTEEDPTVELQGLESTSVEPEIELAPKEEIEEMAGIQRPTDPDLAARTPSLDGFEGTEAEAESGEPEVEVVGDLEVEPIAVEADESELEVEEVELEPVEIDVAAEIPQEAGADGGRREGALAGLSVIADEEGVDGPGFAEERRELEPVLVPTLSLAELKHGVRETPDDPSARRALGEALVEEGQRERGLQELDVAAAQFQEAESLSEAREILEEIVRLEPNSTEHLQKLVELAFRTQNRSRLIGAYLGLADALVRLGAVQKAMAVYDRVLEHDQDNAAARSAVDMLRPSQLATLIPDGTDVQRDIRTAKMQVRDEAPEGTDFVDFRDMVLDEEPADSRIRVGEDEPTGDEERDFVDILEQFRKGIDETIDAEDYQAHYDLGIAFKEMGLLDDAISEFQKAFRASTGQLKTTEALGTCFFDKEQFAVAESILRRGLELPASDDQERIGVLYWLARSLEAQQKVPGALEHYQRVVAVDIRFADVESRVKSLAGA